MSPASMEAIVFDRQGGRKYLNEAERQAFYVEVNKERDTARRVFCLTIFYTGCRISEALNLTARCIDQPQKSVVFETLKRRQRGVFRSVPVPESLITLFGEVLTEATPSERVWQLSRSTAYRLIKAHMIRTGIVGAMASPKGLRHGFAIACIAKKIPLPIIKKWMGHARIETTAIYLDASGDEERSLARRLWERR